jgi:hypothetical protein
LKANEPLVKKKKKKEKEKKERKPVIDLLRNIFGDGRHVVHRDIPHLFRCMASYSMAPGLFPEDQILNQSLNPL